ncbi:probable RNA methyltransferase At5g51130 [Punica granatum]|uniref:RNA methyltransferase n=1 Tax=Punica granatum TaxID=22663 RepID=A0A6P8CWX0_PUNGR|nr:probable RNA methyltransferase At5g51130 [Punica granatum]XP_031385992.1 probable RNA methyltransferase At5g51130 [Punica granatum]
MEAEKEDKVVADGAAEERGQRQQVAEEVKEKKNKRKRKEFAPFGNYRNYYGYRIGHDLDEDPRLKVMKKEWFEGKTCLDIGCNNGIITIHIAKKFGCRSILGIDIDSHRIEDAHWNLRKVVKMEANMKNCTKSSEPKSEENSNGPEQIVNSSLDEEARNTSDDLPRESKDLSTVVSFQHENFVESRHPLSARYDTILCLSVTKWVHLNWGDEGLISLFSKVWQLLQPGGVFVLEPQPWRSYQQNRLVSETTAKNYSRIIFRPQYFQEILLDKIGFRTVEDLTSALSGAKTGFNRPVLAFYK